MVEQKAIIGGAVGISLAAIGEIAGWGLVVLIVSLFGWAVSSLHVLAGWTDDASRLTKLEIIKGVFASIAAAAIVVVIGNWKEWPATLMLISAFLAGMSGDKLLRPLADGLISRASDMLNAALGKVKSDKPRE